MTMTATPRTVNAVGNGVAISFSFGTARIFAATDLVVTVDGVVKTLGADYTVVSGSVVFSVAPADQAAVQIISRMTQTRDTDFTAAGRSTPAQLDADLDRIVALVQEVDEKMVAVATDAGTAAGTTAGTAAGTAAAQPFADAAELSAIAAELSNQNAYTSELNANAARDLAGGYANEAEASAAAAAASEAHVVELYDLQTEQIAALTILAQTHRVTVYDGPASPEAFIYADASAGDIIVEIGAADDPAAKVTNIIKDDSEYVATINPDAGTILGFTGLDLSPGEAIRLFPHAANNNWLRC